VQNTNTFTRPIIILFAGALGMFGTHVLKLCLASPGLTQVPSVVRRSSGYYVEWMREHWLKDKDMTKLALMVGNARRYLRQEAGPYKTYEATMEQEFWNSRIDTKRVSYEEK
jgi:hypothetical protein